MKPQLSASRAMRVRPAAWTSAHPAKRGFALCRGSAAVAGAAACTARVRAGLHTQRQSSHPGRMRFAHQPERDAALHIRAEPWCEMAQCRQRAGHDDCADDELLDRVVAHASALAVWYTSSDARYASANR